VIGTKNVVTPFLGARAGERYSNRTIIGKVIDVNSKTALVLKPL